MKRLLMIVAFGLMGAAVVSGASGCGFEFSESDERTVQDNYGSSLARVVTGGTSSVGECVKYSGKPWITCDIEADPGSGTSMMAVVWPRKGLCWVARPLRFKKGQASPGEREFRGCVRSDDRKGFSLFDFDVVPLRRSEVSGIPDQPPRS